MLAQIDVLHSRYHIPELDCVQRKDNLQIHFASHDHHITESCVQEMAVLKGFVEGFFGFSPILKLYIFMYPTLSSMNKAFGRDLPDENCCFVPIKGPEALITFITPGIVNGSTRAMLVHEYAHVVFGLLTQNREIGRFRQRVPTWLDEGVALYIDSCFRENLPMIEKQRSELVKKGSNDWLPQLEGLHTYFNRLDESAEFGPKGMTAYAFSYFCVKELVSRFGQRTFVRFAASIGSCENINELFNQTFGMTVSRFDHEMRRAKTNY